MGISVLLLDRIIVNHYNLLLVTDITKTLLSMNH
jgi:hypothetical protein